MNEKNIAVFTVGALSALAAINGFCALATVAILFLSCLFTLVMRPLLRQIFTDVCPAEAVCCALFVSVLGFLSDRYLYYRLEEMRPFLPFLAADGALFCVNFGQKNKKREALEILSLAGAILFTGIARELSGGAVFGRTFWNGVGFLPAAGGALLLFGLFSALLPADFGRVPLRNALFAVAAFFLCLLFQFAGAEFSFAEKTMKYFIFLLIAALALYFAEKRMHYTLPERAKKSALVAGAGFFAMALQVVNFL